MASGVTRRRNQRGFAFPSPLVMLSIIAVAMASIAFVATNEQPNDERLVTTVARDQTSATPTPTPTPTAPAPAPEPVVQRGKVYVEVYNNSGITGLAGETAEKIGAAGWQVVGTDNWYGTVPANTVYYPKRLRDAAKLLALDLGIQRVEPAVSPMKLDRLTVILTN